MKVRNTTTILVTLISAFALILALFLWRPSRKSGPHPTKEVSKEVITTKEPTREPAKQRFPTLSKSKLAEKIARVRNIYVVPRGGGPFAADVWALAHNSKGLDLTSAEIAALQDTYIAVSEARLAYEAQHARVSEISPDEFLLEIPTYGDFGAQLRAFLKTGFDDTLGKARSDELFTQLGGLIDGNNAHWGQVPQAISFQFKSESGYYDIDHLIDPKPDPSPTNPQEETVYHLPKDDLGRFAAFASIFPKKTTDNNSQGNKPNTQ